MNPASPYGGCQAASTIEVYGQDSSNSHHIIHRLELTRPHNAWRPRRLLGRTLGGPVWMDVRAYTPAGSYFVPKLAVPRDGPSSRRRMLAALDVTAETIVASTQRGPSGKKWRRVENAKG